MSSKQTIDAPQPSSEFWGKIDEREAKISDDAIDAEAIKRSKRMKKFQEIVRGLNEKIMEARQVNHLSLVATLKIELKSAESRWRFFEAELRDFTSSISSLLPSTLNEIELLYQSFSIYFSADKPPPPTPPNGPVTHFCGSFFGNHYDGDFLPWKRERHGFGSMNYSDGSRIVGTFVRDQIHGVAIMYYKDEVRVFVGGWFRGQRVGQGLLEARHGIQRIRWEGRWIRGMPNGLGVYTTRAGHIISGEWRRPKLAHGGLAIRFNLVKLKLPDGTDFTGKAEIENGPKMQLRVLKPSGNLAFEFGSAKVDLELTKKVGERGGGGVHENTAPFYIMPTLSFQLFNSQNPGGSTKTQERF